MQEICETVLYASVETARNLIQSGADARIAAETAVYETWNTPEITRARLQSTTAYQSATFPGSVSRRLISEVIDVTAAAESDAETAEGVALELINAVMQRIRVAHQLSVSLSGPSQPIRWQDALALSNQGETGDLIQNFTVDGVVLTELLVAALTGSADF